MDYIIIVAGGKGLRMGTDIPKQFLPLCGRPVLMHTLERFRAYSEDLKIILVLPEEQYAYWQELCRKHHFSIGHELARGGATRFHSVQNGLSLIPHDTEGVAGVHDGVRPFPATDVIARCFETARQAKAVIPVIPVTDSLRHVGADGRGVYVPRNDYRMVQTPQTFDIPLLKRAYRQPFREIFTDDASVVESMGRQVVMVEGNKENIKITTAFDLTVAEKLCQDNFSRPYQKRTGEPDKQEIPL